MGRSPVELSSRDLDLSAWVRPGDTVAWSQGCAEPLTLSEALVAQRAVLGPLTLLLGTTTYSSTLRPEHADHLRAIGLSGAAGGGRKLVAAGFLDVLPSHLSEIPRLFADGTLKADVLFVQLSPANRSGAFSTGIANDYVRAAAATARVVIGEVNDQVPWTHSDDPFPSDLLHAVVRTSRPLIEQPAATPGEAERRIGEIVAGLVDDGATLQVGIGAVPDAALNALAGHRRLGVHTGLMGDSVAALMERGVVTNEEKPIDRGTAVTGLCFGTRRLYDFVHENPAVRFAPLSRTHGLDVLSQLPRFVSLNSAVEVDVSGQINGEVASGSYVGAIGGQVDYIRAAARAPGGRSIVALPSTAAGGTVSRIVTRCRDAVVTTPRSDADVIVTEYGHAELRGQPLGERARRLIAIAHPDHREDLSRAAFTAARR